MTYFFSEKSSIINEITPEELKKNLSQKNMIILDVREPDEFAEGHIPSAISIPLGDLPDRINELDKTNDIFIICRSGARSDFAAKVLLNKGYNKVTNVVPGMMDWQGKVKTL